MIIDNFHYLDMIRSFASTDLFKEKEKTNLLAKKGGG